MVRRIVLICALVVGGSACYHATIDTGRTPSNQVVRDGFADSWIYGLVPPSTVETAEECPNGVARVETKLSFVNQLVGFLTLGIYTPMQIVATCATAGSASLPPDTDTVRVGSGPNAARDAFAHAADRAAETDGPAFVMF